MASKIDKVIDRLERLNQDVNEIKAKGIGLLPLPPVIKGALRAISPSLEETYSELYFDGVRAVADVLLPANVAQEIINNPNVLMDSAGAISQIPARPGSRTRLTEPEVFKKPRKVTKKMKMQRKIQSTAFKNANAKGRKVNGEFKKGFDQARIARLAQKECTKERQRLGLCEKPKKKGTRKGQVRKTARRAFEK
tara:strand:- start:325 stop:906 length:582 start_codon:yes stop_codon:yes gene_type:complete